jgi:AbrB family looped-hinge helix DNA binding protein
MKNMTEVIKDRLFLYGTVKVGERGQVVIPLHARDDFDINPGDLLLCVGDKKRDGIGLVKADAIKDAIQKVMIGLGENEEKNKE